MAEELGELKALLAKAEEDARDYARLLVKAEQRATAAEAEVKRLQVENQTLRQLDAEQAVDINDLIAERDDLEELLLRGAWHVREDGTTHLAIRVADGADLSCEALRREAIAQAIAARKEIK